jgi:hypothetical protein
VLLTLPGEGGEKTKSMKTNIINGVLADHEPKRLKIKKACFGCGDYFTGSKQAKYDYCQACGLNGNRYIQNRCAECGDGSGLIKFANQLRACKLCALRPRIVQS